MCTAAFLSVWAFTGLSVSVAYLALAGPPPLARSTSVTCTTAADDAVDRTILPIPEPAPPVVTELDVRNAKAPPRFEVKAPAGAPNVLIVLIDDMGFGQSSAFGGPIHMPTVERLAASGLKFNRFHTTALCSPTRARF